MANFWNPYYKSQDEYHAIWNEAKRFEGKNVRVVKNGVPYVGICELSTVSHPEPGIGITIALSDNWAKWIGGEFELIELVGDAA